MRKRKGEVGGKAGVYEKLQMNRPGTVTGRLDT
jgi:hypothetical protein